MYTKNYNSVYYMGQKIDRASPEGFQELDYGYAKNYNSVYYMGQKIDRASPEGFKVLDYEYAKNYNSVYYRGQKIDRASPEGFKVLDYEYAKNYNSVYYKGQKIDRASPEGFKVLDYGYAKNYNSVYYMGQKIDRASPEGFKIPNSTGMRRNFYGDQSCNFSSETESVTISENGILEGFLTSGRRKKVKLDLNNYLGNDNGRFDLNGRNFSDTSKNLRVVYNGCRLSGELKDKNGRWNYDKINLDDVLYIRGRKINFDGMRGLNLDAQMDDLHNFRLGLGARGRNGQFNAECNIS